MFSVNISGKSKADRNGNESLSAKLYKGPFTIYCLVGGYFDFGLSNN